MSETFSSSSRGCYTCESWWIQNKLMTFGKNVFDVVGSTSRKSLSTESKGQENGKRQHDCLTSFPLVINKGKFPSTWKRCFSKLTSERWHARVTGGLGWSWEAQESALALTFTPRLTLVIFPFPGLQLPPAPAQWKGWRRSAWRSFQVLTVLSHLIMHLILPGF